MRRLLWIAPALLTTRCLFPSLDGLAGADASAPEPETGADASPPEDAQPESQADVATLGTYVQEVTTDSPEAWWRLGENDTALPAKDEMGFQDGTYRVPGVTLGLQGAIAKDTNTAMALDGASGTMFLPGTIFGFGGAPSFAIEVWVSPGAPPELDASDTLRRIVSHRTTAPYYGWYLGIDATQRIVYSRWENSTPIASISSSPLTQNQWAHVVVSADGTTLTLYVNGVFVSQGPEGTMTDMPATHVSFGSTSDFTTEFFDGSLDEPAIYTHALAPARVLAHYQAGIAK